MAILVSETEGEQYFLSGWATDETVRGFRYWHGEKGLVLAAGYVQMKESLNWMWVVFAPDADVLFFGVAPGTSRQRHREMKQEMDRCLADYCELTEPDEASPWLSHLLRYERWDEEEYSSSDEEW